MANEERRYALVVVDGPARARKVSCVLKRSGLPCEVLAGPDDLLPAMDRNEGRPAVFVSVPYLVNVLKICQERPSIDVFTLIAQPSATVFGSASKVSQMKGVVGLQLDETPRAWELLQVGRRLADNAGAPACAPLSWGHTWVERTLSTSEEREDLLEDVRQFCAEQQTKRQAEASAQIADELTMNAMYDAPVDDEGNTIWAHRRDERIELEPAMRPTFAYGSDGERIVLSVVDPFGRLPKRAVFGGIHRGLSSGDMDTRGGGAGIGMMLIHHSAKVLFFDVVPQVRTQATAVIELDIPPADFRKLAGSVHFFESPHAEAR